MTQRKRIPQDYENTTTFLAESISNGHPHIIKSNICCACRCWIASLDRFRLDSWPPLYKNHGKAIFSLTTNSKVIGKTVSLFLKKCWTMKRIKKISRSIRNPFLTAFSTPLQVKRCWKTMSCWTTHHWLSMIFHPLISQLSSVNP